jgi:hypothetical protein
MKYPIQVKQIQLLMIFMNFSLLNFSVFSENNTEDYSFQYLIY